MREPPMGEISIIGLDLAKQVFQVHAADDKGRCILRKQLKRRELLAFFRALAPCIVAMEACGSAHYWAREIAKLGHDARLVPPAYVKAYVKRGKSDRIDAEAICEAAMRFVPVKTIEQQSLTTLHRSRELLVKNRTMLVNALRAHLADPRVKPEDMVRFRGRQRDRQTAGPDQDRERGPGGGAARDGARAAFGLYRYDRAD